MKIVYLALIYPIKKGASSLYSDLISEFIKNGHEVLVIAPYRDGAKLGLHKEGNVDVLRIKTLDLFSSSILKKGMANILLPNQYIKAIKKHIVNYNFDLILIPTPPITLVGVVKWIKKRTQAKVYLILRDIFPQNAVDLKLMKKGGVLHAFFRKKEIELYDVSDSIGCMSKANVEYVKRYNPNLNCDKLHLLPNWQNLATYDSCDNHEVKKAYGLENKFVLIFGGNIGKPQKMENIVSLAKSVEEIEDIVFFIVGKGTEMERLKQLVSSQNLKNMILKDQLPREDYNRLLQIANVGLISLSEDFTIPNFPSKLNSYFNLKIPVLASIDVHTDVGEVLESIQAGFWAEAGNTTLLKEKLIKLYSDKELCIKMGQNGYDYVSKNLLPSHAYSIIKNHV